MTTTIPPRVALFTAAHTAATKLSIAAAELDEATFHVEKAIRQLREANALMPSAVSVGLSVGARLLQTNADRMKLELRSAAAKFYPEAFQEET